ncbi:hypothetical protein [uncultured Mediterranean phage uvMED]|nr:hypothetical protein [uncultured Mediterranean phage uvMED]
MDTDKYKSIALSMDTYNKLRTLSDEQFEMPQSLAKTASYFINAAYSNYMESKDKNAKRKA